MDRNEAIKRIKKSLQFRSGKPWSVTGGRGTAWGWITIDAPPKRRTERFELKNGTPDLPQNYEPIDTGEPGGNMTETDRQELTALLGLENRVHHQGESIPASSDYWQEYVDRAEGRKPSVIGRQYWD